MKFKTLMIIKAVVCIGLGIPILIVPKFFYSLFGVSLDSAGVIPAWEYGASLMGNFFLTWFARKSEESIARRALIVGMTVYNTIGFVVMLIAVINGSANLLGWSAVALYLFFALGFGFFLIKPPKP